MIELSFTKLLLLAVIALVVLGPEKLPKAARMAGAMLRRLRMGWDNVRGEVERELQVEELRRAAREAAERVESAGRVVDAGVRSAHSAVNGTLTDAAAADVAAAHGADVAVKDADHGRA
ncbi:MAG: twin-arginine translocase subunit TatB [Rhodanobacteraceae bacterium]|nr:MAG: twin-arginine translocase subunit TatB [Rhodanobacteraceae bacterium]